MKIWIIYSGGDIEWNKCIYYTHSARMHCNVKGSVPTISMLKRRSVCATAIKKDDWRSFGALSNSPLHQIIYASHYSKMVEARSVPAFSMEISQWTVNVLVRTFIEVLCFSVCIFDKWFWYPMRSYATMMPCASTSATNTIKNGMLAMFILPNIFTCSTPLSHFIHDFTWCGFEKFTDPISPL